MIYLLSTTNLYVTLWIYFIFEILKTKNHIFEKFEKNTKFSYFFSPFFLKITVNSEKYSSQTHFTPKPQNPKSAVSPILIQLMIILKNITNLIIINSSIVWDRFSKWRSNALKRILLCPPRLRCWSFLLSIWTIKRRRLSRPSISRWLL